MVNASVKYFIILFLLSINLSAQSISALASVDSSDYLVGDYINYTLEIRAEKDIEIINPFFRDSLKQVEILKEIPTQKKEDENIKSSTFGYTISYYDSAVITLPPIAVQYKTKGSNDVKVVLSNPVTFTVHTVQVDQQAEIKDVKEPLTIPLDWKFILLIAIIVLVVLAVAYYLYRRYKKKKAEQPVIKKIIKIPAHVRALSALDNLEREQLWQKGRVKEYHSNITGIIRGYFEERFKLPALELTTSEQMQKLKRVPSAKNILSITNEFLNNADLVKFAKFQPMPSVNETMMKQAKEIVTQTILKESAVVEEEVQNV
ncbi:MAG: hypothetical protein IPM14_06990 [bacterium]|nr:hypothetical protein [bacterium]